MRFKNLLLFLFDAIFFSVFFLLLARALNRPLVFLTGLVLFVVYLLILWYFRFYNIEIYFNRVSYFTKILKINMIVFVLFWGIWWFLLKSQWPTVSRLLMISMIFVFGVVYISTIRLFLGNFLLKFSKIYLFLSKTHEKIFLEKISKRARTFVKLKRFNEIKKRVKDGYLFLSYHPGKNIRTRADMWEEYFSYLKLIKKNLSNKKVKVFLFNIYNLELQIDYSNVYLGDIPALEMSTKSNHVYQKIIKRTLDLMFSILLIPIFIVLHPFIFVLIRTNIGKPVIFKQFRIGTSTKTIKLFKYRTMSIISGKNKNEVDKTHRNYIKSLLDEEKVTPFFPDEISKVEKKIRKLKSREEFHITGIILRKTSLDELPQLFNVIKGDMSVIGPRPALDYEVKMFPEWSLNRFDSPQGITGLWQISGRGIMPLHTSLFLDSYYALEYSFWLDVNIFIKTIKSVLNLSSAY